MADDCPVCEVQKKQDEDTVELKKLEDREGKKL